METSMHSITVSVIKSASHPLRRWDFLLFEARSATKGVNVFNTCTKENHSTKNNHESAKYGSSKLQGLPMGVKLNSLVDTNKHIDTFFLYTSKGWHH